MATKIKTWEERCQKHPDHQEGMITHDMIKQRMQEEIDELRTAYRGLASQLGKLRKAQENG